MDDRFDAVIRKDPLDHRPVRNRSDDIGYIAGNHVESDHAVAGRLQPRNQEASQPAGRPRQQHTHGIGQLSENFCNRGLRIALDSFQMIRADKTFRVDLVDVFRA